MGGGREGQEWEETKLRPLKVWSGVCLRRNDVGCEEQVIEEPSMQNSRHTWGCVVSLSDEMKTAIPLRFPSKGHNLCYQHGLNRCVYSV